ncbi:MAG: methyltransferase [Myxococcota bacterium]|nr:methyltransferase [Myxococcota bacterium]
MDDGRARQLARWERCFDVLLGLSIVFWAVVAIGRVDAAERFTPVRLSISALNLTVGILFLARRPLEAGGGVRRSVLALPSLAASGVAMSFAPPPSEWFFFMSVFFTAATAWSVSSLLWLGRSFSVLPARRGLVTGGPYRLLRHPVYMGELLMLQVVGAASGSRLAQLICFGAIPLMAVRILAEERVLAGDPAWGAYVRRTRWRLVPWRW